MIRSTIWFVTVGIITLYHIVSHCITWYCLSECRTTSTLGYYVNIITSSNHHVILTRSEQYKSQQNNSKFPNCYNCVVYFYWLGTDTLERQRVASRDICLRGEERRSLIKARCVWLSLSWELIRNINYWKLWCSTWSDSSKYWVCWVSRARAGRGQNKYMRLLAGCCISEVPSWRDPVKSQYVVQLWPSSLSLGDKSKPLKLTEHSRRPWCQFVWVVFVQISP